jgi:apolipoprotein N-acyltransferase
MGNDRSMVLLQGLVGGLLAGVALSVSGPWWMVPALALLWSASSSFLASALWGGVAVLLSHRWLLALHPLMWIGVPAGLSLPVAVAIWLACALLAALLLVCWSGLVNRLPLRGSLTHAVLAAAVWGLVEVALSQSPLFWIGVGGSLLPADPPLAALSRWIGEGGLASLQLLLGWWLWRLLTLSRRESGWPGLLAGGLLSLVVLHGVGAKLLQNPVAVDAQSDRAQYSVGLWQPAIPTREKFSAQRQRDLPGRLQVALQEAEAADSDWLIAPEGTLPLNGSLSAPAPIALMSGGFRWSRGRQHSAMVLVEAGDTTPVASIDKHRLVPLGEWVPSWPGLSGLSAIGGLEAGEPSRLWRWGGPPAAVAICYEISNGAAVARAVADGAEWILAAANLDPYPRLLQQQYLALAQLRSIETARPLLSTANTGPTAMIRANGQIAERLASFDPGLLVVPFQPRQGLTGYVRWGEAPLLLLIGASSLLLIRSASRLGPRPTRPRRRKTQPLDQE